MFSKKILSLIFILLLLLTLTNSIVQICNAQEKDEDKPKTTSETVSLTNPIGETDISVLIGRVIKAILGIVGSLALVMFIYGGVTWMTSAGNAEKVQKGKDTLVWAAIGLVIIFASYALVRFVIQDAILGTAI